MIQNPFRLKKISLNSKVLVRFEDGVEEWYQLVVESLANIAEKKLSVDSPLAQAILDHYEQEKIEFMLHGREKVSCEIVKII
jgi:transcription elongation GreA/GreB family factor